MVQETQYVINIDTERGKCEIKKEVEKMTCPDFPPRHPLFIWVRGVQMRGTVG